MTNPQRPIVIQLTEEQQKLVHRMSGQHMRTLELTPDANDATSGSGRSVEFRWRNSIATGIPRQQWVAADNPDTLPSREDAPAD